MSDKQRSERKGGGAAVLAVGLLVVPLVLYVASVGPVSAMAFKGQLGSYGTYAYDLYAPLDWARGESPAIDRVLGSYCWGWAVHSPGAWPPLST